MLEDDKKKFILNAALGSAILDSFRIRGGTPIYTNHTTDEQRKILKNTIKQYLKDNLEVFLNQTDIDRYINAVFDFSKHFSDKFSGILIGERLRIGIAQKLIGMFLKYLWIYGYINNREPFLCPFDNIILQQHLKLNYQWTALDDIKQYRDIIQAAIKDANGLSLAQWELLTYNQITDNQ